MCLEIHILCYDTFCRIWSKYRQLIVLDDLVELLDSEDEGGTVLRNVDKFLSVHMA
jgi:hypothetical protein